MGSFNGSGLFVRSFNWVTDKINGVNITASRCDTEDDGFAAGLSNCVTRDGQGKMAADLTPGSDAAYNLGTPSARWKAGAFSSSVDAQDYIQRSGRILKTAQQSITNSASPIADTQLIMTPVVVGSYLVEARMSITANPNAGSGGLKVGLFAQFINFNCGIVTYNGFIGGSNVALSGGFANDPSANPSFNFNFVSASGVANNWIVMKGTINILNVTGPQLIGVHWCQSTATAGGTLTAEAGSYLSMTRIS